MRTQELLEIVTAMAHSPVEQYVVPGLTSSLIGGRDCGAQSGTVRLFSSDRQTREWITPHSHRFDFSCIVLDGLVENILFTLADESNKRYADSYSLGTLKCVGEGMGSYDIVRSNIPEKYTETSTRYGVGESYAMKSNQIHSIKFHRGTKVLFFEGPTLSDTSVFLEPFSNGRVVETFETRPWMFKK